MAFLQFLDRLIPYDTFLNDVAARVVSMLKTDMNDPEYVSQRKAYDMFGRANVERWRKQGKVDRAYDPVRLNTAPPIFDFSNELNRTISRINHL